MEQAILEANKGCSFEEVPIGAVIIDNLSESIIAKTHNQTVLKKNATQHAEILAIEIACKKLNSKYLNNTSIFVTLEPCAMCAAAISAVKINYIYFGAYDEKRGSLESIMNIYKEKNIFVPEVYGGVNEIECSMLLKNFFKEKRLANAK
tara:strand:- start:6705 stop:7151 length:447 start_codon:yes stop_codon:yes gene_type:complete